MTSLPLSRVVATLVLLLIPVAIVIASLTLAAPGDWRWAVVGLIVIGVALGLIVYRHLAGLAALHRRIDDLARDRPAIDLPATSPVTAELAAAVNELNRSWTERSADLQSLFAANEAILEGIPDPLLILDTERRVLRVNSAARDLLGSDIVGADLARALRDPDVLQAVDEAAAGRAAATTSLNWPGPVERHFSARIVRLPTNANGPAQVMLALYDVTPIKRAEFMRADFVANVSHELRTPLATLLGFIETLRGPARDDASARERFLGIMHDQATRMSRLVRDLLSLSKIESNEQSPPTAPVALGPLLAGVIDGLTLQAKAKSIAVHVDIAGDLPPVIGDADQLAQVFQNLIDNAIKYGRPSTAVRVTAQSAAKPITAGGRMPARLVAVAIGDEGEGIPREHLPRLTERFYRVDAGRSRQLGGTGLGLAIVKHIINRHRGALTIDSEVGRGSLFTVYLPAESVGATPEAIAAALARSTAKAGRPPA